MKLWIGILGLLLSLAAQANDVAFKKRQQVVVNMGPGCNVRMKIPEAAKISVTYSKNSGKGGAGLKLENPFSLKTKKYIEPFYFGFTCYPANEGIVTRGWASFNDADKKWQINLSPDDAKMFVNAHMIYQLKAVNASGWAVTIDDVTGDEQWRQRHLHYCLIKGTKALCGNGEMGDLKEGKKGDLTPYALQILRSIEFIDDVPSEQAPVSPDVDMLDQ